MKRRSSQRPTIRNLTGRQIKRLRLASSVRITQEDMVGRLARQGLALNQAQVAKIENGVRAISDIELVAFAKALRVEVQALFQT